MTQTTTTVPDAGRGRWGLGRGTGVVVIVTIAVLAALFWLGAQWGGRTHSATAYCLSAPGQIGCTENPDGSGRGFLIPRDVAWSDEAGALHDGRPECLPPVGVGNIRTTFRYESVDVNGYQHDVAVWVDCATAQPVR